MADLNALKADIPFLRGGKQLTPTEAKRVDKLLNPFGKKPNVYKRDIEIFQKEFYTGKEIMKHGALAKPYKPIKSEQTSNKSDYSSLWQ